jgi:hypothetical protein
VREQAVFHLSHARDFSFAMKYSYEIFPTRRVIATRYRGLCTLGDLTASTQRLWADPRYSRAFDGIVDMSEASAGVGIDDFRAFLKFLRQEPKISQGRWAAVTTTPFATACSFMYRSAMAGRHTLEIFSTWDAACEFLDFVLPRDTPLRGGEGNPVET